MATTGASFAFAALTTFSAAGTAGDAADTDGAFAFLGPEADFFLVDILLETH